MAKPEKHDYYFKRLNGVVIVIDDLSWDRITDLNKLITDWLEKKEPQVKIVCPRCRGSGVVDAESGEPCDSGAPPSGAQRSCPLCYDPISNRGTGTIKGVLVVKA
jgi:hypothetical protein